MPPESGTGNQLLDNVMVRFSDEDRCSQILQQGSDRNFIVKQSRIKSRPKQSTTNFCIPYFLVLPCPTGTPASPCLPGLCLHYGLHIVYADICWKEDEELDVPIGSQL